MRHNALFRKFISALTRGGPGGLPRPIEVHAHDPLRYVGDMLGWLHQVLFEDVIFGFFLTPSEFNCFQVQFSLFNVLLLCCMIGLGF